MLAAWAFKRLGDRRGAPVPFFMELPPYRLPAPRAVLVAMWSSARAFLCKCSTVIVGTSIVLWLLLNLPLHTNAQLHAAGVDTADSVAVSAYDVDHSYAADLGRLVAPVFDPLGFDWRINVGVLSAQAARETFVATLGQVAAAENPEQPDQALRQLTYPEGPRAGLRVFTEVRNVGSPVLGGPAAWFLPSLPAAHRAGQRPPGAGGAAGSAGTRLGAADRRIRSRGGPARASAAGPRRDGGRAAGRGGRGRLPHTGGACPGHRREG
jgi:hypothetical protein